MITRLQVCKMQVFASISQLTNRLSRLSNSQPRDSLLYDASDQL